MATDTNSTQPAENQDRAQASQNSRMLMRLITITTLWPWFYLTFFSDTVLLPTDSLLKVEPVFRSVGLAAAALTFLLLVVLGKRVLKGRRLSILAGFVLVGSPWTVILASTVTEVTQTTFIAECVAWAALGIAVACLMFLAHPAPNNASQKDTVQSVSIAFTLGSFVYLVCSLMPLAAARVVAIALPYISLLSLYLNRSAFYDEHWYENLAQCPKGQLWHSFQAQPSQLVYGIVCGFGVSTGISLMMTTTNQFPMSLAIAFCLAGPAGIMLAQLTGKLVVNNIEWFLMPVACVGLLPIIIGNATVIISCCAVLAFLYTFYELLHIIQLNEQMREQPDIAPYAFAAGEAIFYIGVTLGWTAHLVLHRHASYSSVFFYVTIIVIVLFVICVISYIGRPSARTGSVAEAATPLKSAPREDDILNDIATGANLTARQTEIFIHLAHGRNAPYIAEKLVVSYHTVKAHMYQIYRKLEVHSQQDLIDLIEERMHDA